MEYQNQEAILPDNNEEVIKMLGLNGNSKLLDDIVRTLDLDSFTLMPSLAPVASAIGYESIQGQQQLVGNALGTDQPTETISYIDLSPTISYVDLSPVPPPGNSPYHGSGGTLIINEDTPPASPQEVNSVYITKTNSPVASPQEVSSFVPTTPVEKQDDRETAVGKIPRRRRELKPKLYQREEPLSDPEDEKKRQNAINAKRNRDKKKSRQQELESLVQSLTDERDALKTTNTKLKNKCESFETQLKKVCQQFNVPVIILPEG